MATNAPHTFVSDEPKQLVLPAADTPYEVKFLNHHQAVSLCSAAVEARYRITSGDMGADDDWFPLPAGAPITVDLFKQVHGGEPVIHVATPTAGSRLHVLPLVGVRG